MPHWRFTALTSRLSRVADGRGFFYFFPLRFARKERMDTTHATRSTRTPADMIIRLISSYNVIRLTSLLLLIDQEAIRPVTGAFLTSIISHFSAKYKRMFDWLFGFFHWIVFPIWWIFYWVLTFSESAFIICHVSSADEIKYAESEKGRYTNDYS